MRQTPLSRLIEVTLALDLRAHVIAEREAGKDWRTIATDLSERSGHSVSHESVRSWFSDEADLVVREAGQAHPLLLVAVVLVAWVAAFNTPPGTLLVGLIGVCGAVVLAGFAWAAGVRTLARRAVVARGRRD